MPSETIANGESEIIHRLDLNSYGLEEVTDPELRQAAKQEAADYLQNEILRTINSGTSPVAGEGRFPRLTQEYAEEEKGGLRLANLENEGDLLNDFRVRNGSDSFLDIGHRGTEVPKSDGHNQLSDKAKAWARRTNFPRRRYIPDNGQRYSRDITNQLENIIRRYIRPSTENDIDIDIESEAIASSETTSNSIGLFDDDVVESLASEAIRRRG